MGMLNRQKKMRGRACLLLALPQLVMLSFQMSKKKWLEKSMQESGIANLGELKNIWMVQCVLDATPKKTTLKQVSGDRLQKFRVFCYS